MTADPNSLKPVRHKRPDEAEEIPEDMAVLTHALLMFTLFLSAVSSILALFVARVSRQESEAARKKAKQSAENVTSELQGLHKDIALLKKLLNES